MRRIADPYPGEAKTDARDAHIIADAGRTLPHALRRVGLEEHTIVELAVLAGYDADLATEATQLTNRLHDALLHVHPALERLLGNQFRSLGVLRLLAATGTPAAIAALGPARIKKAIAVGSPRIAGRLTGERFSRRTPSRRSSSRPPSSTARSSADWPVSCSRSWHSARR
jgi:hypothetical protein